MFLQHEFESHSKEPKIRGQFYLIREKLGSVRNQAVRIGWVQLPTQGEFRMLL